ncbi:MAG: AAA family ATPase [Deltaproteobacteria bacterium]|nr:AAA family ATPase [Deltaproteobacteria bacterium]
MYLAYFGFRERPFSVTPDASYFFMTKQYEAALDTLLFAIRERLGFMVLTGEVGTGKTTLSRELLNRLDESVATAMLVNPLLSVPELLQAINRDFGNPVRILSPQRQIESLNKFLLKLHAARHTALVIVDESQNLSFEALEMIRMLSNLETDKAKLLQILLVGQPELDKKLAGHALRQLRQRIVTRSSLQPLQFLEMVRYITHRLTLAGGKGRVYIEPGAYRLLYRRTDGIPRLINMLCDRALTAAYVLDTPIITKGVMRQAVRDLQGWSEAPGWQFWKRLRWVAG